MVLSRGRAWYRACEGTRTAGRQAAIPSSQETSTVEGVSLVVNHLAQFDKIIRAPSAQGLVQRLRAKQ